MSTFPVMSTGKMRGYKYVMSSMVGQSLSRIQNFFTGSLMSKICGLGHAGHDSTPWVTYPKLVQIGWNKLSTLEGNYWNQSKHLAKQNCFKSEGPESACSWNLATLNNSFLCQHKYHSLFFPEGCRVFPLDNPALRFRRMVSQLSPAWAPSKLNISKSLLSPQSRPGEKFRLLGPSDSR